MTPVGKLFLSIPDIELDDLEMVYFSYWMISLFLLYLGIICLARSQEIMEGKQMNIIMIIMIVMFMAIMTGFTYIWNRFAKLENSENSGKKKEIK